MSGRSDRKNGEMDRLGPQLRLSRFDVVEQTTDETNEVHSAATKLGKTTSIGACKPV